MSRRRSVEAELFSSVAERTKTTPMFFLFFFIFLFTRNPVCQRCHGWLAHTQRAVVMVTHLLLDAHLNYTIMALSLLFHLTTTWFRWRWESPFNKVHKMACFISVSFPYWLGIFYAFSIATRFAAKNGPRLYVCCHKTKKRTEHGKSRSRASTIITSTEFSLYNDVR